MIIFNYINTLNYSLDYNYIIIYLCNYHDKIYIQIVN